MDPRCGFAHRFAKILFPCAVQVNKIDSFQRGWYKTVEQVFSPMWINYRQTHFPWWCMWFQQCSFHYFWTVFSIQIKAVLMLNRARTFCFIHSMCHRWRKSFHGSLCKSEETEESKTQNELKVTAQLGRTPLNPHPESRIQCRKKTYLYLLLANTNYKSPKSQNTWSDSSQSRITRSPNTITASFLCV